MLKHLQSEKHQKRAVRLSLNQNKYEYKTENVRGGKTYKIKYY